MTYKEPITSVLTGYPIAVQILKTAQRPAFLSSVLVDFENTNNTLNIRRLHYNFYEAPGSGTKRYKSYRVEVDNAFLQAHLAATGELSSRQITEFAALEPDFFPPRVLDLSVVSIDLTQVVQLAFQEPPYFILTQLQHFGYLDVTLGAQETGPCWRVLCEHNQMGFRTIHLDAKTGTFIVDNGHSQS
jgi:hypothetical protein